jgi:hypothetical protein
MRCEAMRFFRSLDFLIVFVVSLLFVSGFSIFIVNRPFTPSFSIRDVSFNLGEDERSIELHVRGERGRVELKQLFINNGTVYDWIADKRIIGKGEEVRCTLKYRWRMGEDYFIKLVAADGGFAELAVRAPETAPSLSVEVIDVNVALRPWFLKVDVKYEVDGEGLDRLHMLLFTYLSLERMNRTVYVFYDRDYMADESLERADAIIRYFDGYNVTICKVDYGALEELSKSMPRVALILVNPLKDGLGRELENASPAPLVDSDRDGYLRDDSRYGRSILYDWMRDEGLILVTVGSLQPYKRIIYDDGVYSYAKDSYSPFDAHLFLTDAWGEESIIKGGVMLGEYAPTRISSTLGLSYREASFGFDRDAMEGYGLQYYSYGDYELPYEHGNLNLTLPVFIRVGEGGWLAMGDEELWLSGEQLARDLFLICLQAVWDSEWIPYGWYWDSGCAFHECSGVMRADGGLETELIPPGIIDGEFIIRIVGIASSPDLRIGVLVDRILEYEVP